MPQSQIFLALLFCIILLLFLHNSLAFGCDKHKSFLCSGGAFVFSWCYCGRMIRKRLTVNDLGSDGSATRASRWYPETYEGRAVSLCLSGSFVF